MSAHEAIAPLAARDGEATFAEPWQAQVLAIAFALTEGGACTPAEWSEALGAELARAADHNASDDAETYYHAALRALERLAGISPTQLASRASQWRDAYLTTPHGQPVKLAPPADR